MSTETTPAPKTVSDLTLAELLTLLQETVTEALGGIVGCLDEVQVSSQGSVVKKAEPGSDAAARMARKVSELEVDELEWWVYYVVDAVGVELIGDPDEGLELSAWAEEQLKQSAADKAAGRIIPLEEAAKRLGLSP